MWFVFWHHLPSLYFDIANILRKADKFQSVWINFTFLKSAHVECTKISLRLNLMWKFVGNWHCNIHRARKIFKVMFFSFDQRMNLINIGPNMWICQILTFVVLEKYFILGKNGRNFHSIWEDPRRRPWGEIENIWPSYLCIISPGRRTEHERSFSLFKEHTEISEREKTILTKVRISL